MRELVTLGGAARARVRVPDDWIPRAGSLVVANEHGEAIAGVQLTDIGDEDPARVVDATFARQRQGVLALAIVERGALPGGGVYQVGRFTRPPGAHPAFPERLYAVAARGRIAAHGWAPLDRDDLIAIVVEAVKTYAP